MSISLGSLSNKLWQGLSTDTKPTAADGRLAFNDAFFETDTQKYYLWDGSTWHYTGAVGVPPPMA